MGLCFKLGLVVLVVSSLGLYQVYKNLTHIPPIPTLENTWWGSGDPAKEDSSIKPFKINVSDDILNDLNHRLQNFIPLQPALEGVNQHYGIHSDHLNSIINYWRTKYNWKERQQYLNKFPQYTVSVQGLKIHYIHVKPEKNANLKVFPLLLVHGWPGSVREFYEIIPYLTTPQKGRNFVFEVIAPSIPGYAFSEATKKPGLGPAQTSVIFKNLMKTLKFDKFYVQGGDWGAFIVTFMSILFPQNVIGVHSNMCHVNTGLANLLQLVGTVVPSLVVTPEEHDLVYPLSNRFSFLLLESGYMHLQATKPDTAGVALRDSAVGTAAYILEKFTTWTNPAYKDLPDGGLTKRYKLDDLLDNVMIYWVTRSMTTSMRFYAEHFSATGRNLGADKLPILVPSGCARFSHELLYPPKKVLETRYHNLLHLSNFEGGHFAAFEVPDLLANDIYEFVEKVQTLAVQDSSNKSEL